MAKAVPFAPSVDAERLDDLRTRLGRACEEASRRPEPVAPFEMTKPRFGMTHARHRELLFAWRDFLSPGGSTSATEGRSSSGAGANGGHGASRSSKASKRRPGPDHDTWQAFEKRLTDFSHFTMDIEDVNIHFIHEKASPSRGGAATTTTRPVIPLLLLHGWPSSVHDFFNVIEPLAHPGDSAPPDVPAFDVIVPSQTGYLWSSAPQVDAFGYGKHSGSQGDLLLQDEARIIHKLMISLGYKKYVIQAGDWGAAQARHMASQFPKHVVALHLNFCPSPPPLLDPPLLRLVPQQIKSAAWALTPRPIASVVNGIWTYPRWRSLLDYTCEPTLNAALGHALFGLPAPLNAKDRAKVKTTYTFITDGSAYASMQGTRPSTLGLVLQSDPAALLAWIGEKMHAWTDEDPSDADVCSLLTLWWVTDTMSTSIYQYRNRPPAGASFNPNYAIPIRQPTGMSDCPRELMPAPLSWMRQITNIRWYREHAEGGHFLALERPALFVDDLRDCFAQLWPRT